MNVKASSKARDAFYESVKREYGLDMTPSHQAYADKIRHNTCTFGSGYAGTGKTAIAIAEAIKELKAGNVSRIVVTRPTVEATSNGIGFLPGDKDEKFSVYLEPVKALMFELESEENVKRWFSEGKIQAKPLAFMRGLTWNNTFLIADEMSNASLKDIALLLQRIGHNTKVVLTGDHRQVDLRNERSGWVEAIKILKHVPNIAIHEFGLEDVKRSGFCRDVLAAFEKHETRKAEKRTRI